MKKRLKSKNKFIVQRLSISGGFFIFTQIVLFTFALMPLGEKTSQFLSGEHAHFIAIFLTSLFLSGALLYSFPRFKWPLIITLSYSIFLSVFLEYVQEFFTTWRTRSTEDILFGVSAAIAYYVLAHAVLFVRKKLQ